MFGKARISDSSSEIDSLREEVLYLRAEKMKQENQIEQLARRVDALENRDDVAVEDPVELRNVSDEQASEEILALFNTHCDQTIYYSDIADELCLDLAQVVRVCNKLETENRIEEVDNCT